MKRVSSSATKSLRDQLYISDDSKTFENDDKLPSLPVPSLIQTLECYLDTIRPVVNDEEFSASQTIIAEFERGPGKELQQRLIARSKTSRNWLEDWWLTYAYLQSRTPLLPLSNMCGPIPVQEYWPPQVGSRVERLALSLFHNMEYWTLLRNETMRPMVRRDVAWDMNQFRRLYNTCRIPENGCDRLTMPFKCKSEGAPGPLNVIILCRGYIFSFDAIDPELEEPYTPHELAFQLTYIENWCETQSSDGPGLGALTTDERNKWAANRKHLISLSKSNKHQLELIENALLVLVMESAEPRTQTEIMQEVMCGDCSNRWADKSVTHVVFKNGVFGAMADHSPFDGIATAIATHFQLMSLDECSGVYEGTKSVKEMRQPQRLDLVLDERIHREINTSKRNHRKNSMDIELLLTVFEEFGKSILKDHRFHPEAFVQMALQLAYYRMHGRAAPVYVTASTRQFYHGRTETCRACFPESVEFIKSVVCGTFSPAALYSLLKKAITKFIDLMTKATNGEGIDRHLMGLYLVGIENGLDVGELFTDPSFIKTGGAGNYILSTSCSGYWNLSGGVPPMRNDGYGCFYGIEDNQITFCCTAFKSCPETSAEEFLNNVRISLMEMQNILNYSKL